MSMFPDSLLSCLFWLHLAYRLLVFFFSVTLFLRRILLRCITIEYASDFMFEF